MNEEQIRGEIARRKELAKSKGVMEIGKLYYSKLRFFPHWIKNKVGYTSSLVTSAIEELDKEPNKVRTKLSFNNREFVFTFSQNSFYTPDGKMNNHGDLELSVDGKDVLALSMAEHNYEYYSEWAAFEVDAFIDGDWLQDLQELETKIKEEEKAAKKKRENEELEEQKGAFGIS